MHIPTCGSLRCLGRYRFAFSTREASGFHQPIVTRRNIRVGAQPPFQHVLPNLIEERVGRVAFRPLRLRCQRGGEAEQWHSGIEPRRHKEGTGEARYAGRRAHHPMQCRLEIAVGGQLQQLADIDHQRSRLGGAEIQPSAVSTSSPE